jgi:hypothetical protein
VLPVDPLAVGNSGIDQIVQERGVFGDRVHQHDARRCTAVVQEHRLRVGLHARRRAVRVLVVPGHEAQVGVCVDLLESSHQGLPCCIGLGLVLGEDVASGLAIEVEVPF